ncbi:unnamed protein product [Caenorhabditis auriculariae]|uniref:Uncharacterized protein n=1 Tax=Caenorhabditis auriculariae TaxID=2777116 RepID=A0A8S1GZA0_9PELO|nr:unnamed protein product [Caenorhabditis auriculariae]
MTNEAIRRLQSSAPDVDWSSPPESSDVLAMPVSKGNVVVMPHPNANRAGPEFHMGTVGALTSLKKYAATENDEDTITQIRESFAESFHVRSIDVGFDSVVASIVGSCIRSWALVRGVADYQHGQSRAGKLWQAYAAARAAAMTRSIIERLPPPS